jgi:hypothetical protein
VERVVVTNQAILQKAIEKAIEGGWVVPRELTFISSAEFLVYLTNSTPDSLEWVEFKTNELIYSHEFARCLWGDEPGHTFLHDFDTNSFPVVGAGGVDNWQYHLQQMVIAPDPILYLGENI